MSATGINHVSVHAADLDASEAFYREFAQYIKEGAATDFSLRESLAKLLRYESSATAPGTLISASSCWSRIALADATTSVARPTL